MAKDPYQRLLHYAFWLLGRKAYSEQDMRVRMSRFSKKKSLEQSGALIEKVMERLKELGYVNDDALLRNFFEYRLASRPIGKFAFIQRMMKQGISGEKAKAAWDERKIDEASLAEELFQKKQKQLNKKGLTRLEQKKKLAAFLAARGFSASTVWGLMEKLC